jgi:hypothetical protein
MFQKMGKDKFFFSATTDWFVFNKALHYYFILSLKRILLLKIK